VKSDTIAGSRVTGNQIDREYWDIEGRLSKFGEIDRILSALLSFNDDKD